MQGVLVNLVKLTLPLASRLPPCHHVANVADVAERIETLERPHEGLM